MARFCAGCENEEELAKRRAERRRLFKEKMSKPPPWAGAKKVRMKTLNLTLHILYHKDLITKLHMDQISDADRPASAVC